MLPQVLRSNYIFYMHASFAYIFVEILDLLMFLNSERNVPLCAYLLSIMITYPFWKWNPVLKYLFNFRKQTFSKQFIQRLRNFTLRVYSSHSKNSHAVVKIMESFFQSFYLVPMVLVGQDNRGWYVTLLLSTFSIFDAVLFIDFFFFFFF